MGYVLIGGRELEVSTRLGPQAADNPGIQGDGH